MSFSADLYTFLTADPTLAGLVGNRIHPNRVAPNEIFPYIRIVGVSAEPMPHLAGYNTHRAPIIQFSVFSRSYDTAITIRDRLLALFNGFRGAMGGTFIQSVMHLGDQEFWEDGTPEGNHHFSVDFKFTHNV